MREAWRIEHPDDGLGPYRYNDEKYDVDISGDADWRHPHHGAIPEGRWLSRDVIRYACHSLDALWNWFDEQERAKCAAKGYVVARYQVEPDHWWPGDKQVAFDVTKAQRLEVHPIPIGD